MKLEKKSLLKALEVAVSVAKNRATMPILSFLRIEAIDDAMTIHATDLDCHAISSCECKGSLPPICVPAQKFYGLAKSAGPEIWLTMENGRLRFESNGSAALSTMAVDDFPKFPDTGLTAIGLPCGDLADGLEAVSWCTAKEAGDRPLVTNVYVRITAKQICCYAANGKQLAYFTRGLICAETEFIVPAVLCQLLADALGEDGANLQVSTNQVVVNSENLTVAVKRFDGPFFSAKNMLEAERRLVGDVEIKPLVAALECAQMVGADASRFAKVHMIPARDRTRAQCQSTTDSYLTWLPFLVPGRVNIDAALLLQSLQQFDSPKVKMSIGASMDNAAGSIILEHGDLLVANAGCLPSAEVGDPDLVEALAEQTQPVEV